MPIHANVGGPNTVPVFNAGGGGSNGCGKITNMGTPQFFGGAIAIGNPGGISVTNANIQTKSDTNSTPGIDGVCGPACSVVSRGGTVRSPLCQFIKPDFSIT